MKIVEIRCIANYIIKHCDNNNCLLTDYIADIINELEQMDKVNDADIIIEQLCDSSTSDYRKLIRELNSLVSQSGLTARISIHDDFDGDRIFLSDLGIKTIRNISIEMWNSFDKILTLNKTTRGIIYEKFCCEFLKDLGLESQITAASNDKGIDILAKHKVNLAEDLASLVFNDYVYLLGQAKFFNCSIDTPVLRKLVGDAFFLRFDKLEYVDISHNAVHLVVFSHNGYTQPAIEFGKTNKIMMLDSTIIVNIVASSINPKKWSSYNFLISEASKIT